MRKSVRYGSLKVQAENPTYFLKVLEANWSFDPLVTHMTAFHVQLMSNFSKESNAKFHS